MTYQPQCHKCGRFCGLDARVVSFKPPTYRCARCWRFEDALDKLRDTRAPQRIYDELRGLSCATGRGK